ncbi:MAG TPA: recombination mediator RecR [Candidatus Omnitrophota bacterium]|nr:recombination mediator RecR [Candidatus Omnitrophota bacterium]
MSYPKLVEQLIEQFSRLPGIGRRSAERMVFWLLNSAPEESAALSDGIRRLKEELRFCQECNSLTDQPTCRICQDESRDRSVICVVENPKDLLAIERTGVFRGLYHVLLGAISPSDGRGPDDLKVEHLLGRIERLKAREVLIATDADTEGEMTALFIADRLRSAGIRVSRIGVGIPMGSSVEYVDHSTLTMSLNSRREMVIP